MRPLTLLLLSGGGHTGANVVATLASRREGVRLVATSDTAGEPSLFAFDAAYLAPPIATQAAAFEAKFVAILAREQPDLVIPCRDEDVEWLGGFRGRHAADSTRVQFLCGPPQIAAIANDKWVSHEFALQHGLPFVPSLAGAPSMVDRAKIDTFIAHHGLPLVAKPRNGVDSNDIVLLHTEAQVHLALARAGTVVQKYLGLAADVNAYLAQIARDGIPLTHTFQGVKRSLQALIGPTGEVVHLFCTRNQMSGRNARTVSVDTDPDARDIGQRCAQVFAAAGWRGPLNAQCQPTEEGTLLIHEFNARFTGATAARAWLGYDEVGAAVQAFVGRSLAPLPTRQCAAEAREGLAARGADSHDAGVLAATGEWTAAAR